MIILQKIYDYILNSDDKEKEIKELIDFFEEDIKEKFKKLSDEEITKAEKSVIFYLDSFTKWKIDFLSKNEAFNEFIKKYNLNIKMSINESVTEFKNLQEIDEIYLMYEEFANEISKFKTDFEKIYMTLILANFKMNWAKLEEVKDFKKNKEKYNDNIKKEQLENVHSHKCIKTGLAVCQGFNNVYTTIMDFLNIPFADVKTKEVEGYHILNITKMDGKWYFFDTGTNEVILGKILIAIRRGEKELKLRNYSKLMHTFKGREYAKKINEFLSIQTKEEEILKHDKEFRELNGFENQKDMLINGERYFTFVSKEDFKLVEFKDDNSSIATINPKLYNLIENIEKSSIYRELAKEYAKKMFEEEQTKI